jgi:hypothetical protein
VVFRPVFNLLLPVDELTVDQLVCRRDGARRLTPAPFLIWPGTLVLDDPGIVQECLADESLAEAESLAKVGFTTGAKFLARAEFVAKAEFEAEAVRQLRIFVFIYKTD